jgi:hypothetical protein
MFRSWKQLYEETQGVRGTRARRLRSTGCYRWAVAVCTRGGNQSWNGMVKYLDPSAYDRLFVLVADGRRWFIPSNEIVARTCIVVGGPKYSEYEIEPGRPIRPPADR